MKRLTFVLFFVSLIKLAEAQVPGTLSYQGLLVATDGTPVTDGDHTVKFDFYTVATAGTAVLSMGPFTVTTYKGMFTFILGSGAPTGNDPLPEALGASQHYIEVIADGVALSPRAQLTTVPYAIKAQSANTMDASGLTGIIKVNAGNVGIGTTSPQVNLEVSTTATTSTQIMNLYAPTLAAGNYVQSRIGVGSATNNAAELRFRYIGNGSTSNRLELGFFGQQGPMSLLANGNVGIGTTTPNAALQLGNVITNRRIVLWEDGNNDHQYYGFGINGSILRYQVPGPGQSHVFYGGTSTTASKELLRITGSGNVGIGTATPRGRLDLGTTTTEGSIFGMDQLIGLNDLRFYTDNVGTTPRMFISGTGNVGIGTTSPNKRLTVDYAGLTNDYGVAEFRGAGTHSWGINLVLRTTGGSDGANLLFRSRDSKNWKIGGEPGPTATGFQISENGGDGEFGSGHGTPRMHIAAGGNVGIGMTNPSVPLEVSGANGLVRITPNFTPGGGTMLVAAFQSGAATTNGAQIRFGNGTNPFIDIGGNGSGNFVVEGNDVVRMTVTQAGNVGIGTTSPTQKLHVIGNILASGTITPSDVRLKKNVTNLNYGLSEVMKLRPVSYVMKDNAEGRRDLGLIAQEAFLITPEVVIKPKTENEFYAMNYTQLIPVLIKAIQEQQAQINELKSNNSGLKAELDQYKELSAQIEVLKRRMDLREGTSPSGASVSGSSKK